MHHCDASLQQEFQHLEGALRDNGYPQHVLIRELSVLPPVRPTKDVDVEEKEVVVAIPYVHGMSEALRRILSMYNIRVAFKPVLTLRRLLTAPKDPIPTLDRPM